MAIEFTNEENGCFLPGYFLANDTAFLHDSEAKCPINQAASAAGQSSSLLLTFL
jgi:hypothetical protein